MIKRIHIPTLSVSLLIGTFITVLVYMAMFSGSDTDNYDEDEETE